MMLSLCFCPRENTRESTFSHPNILAAAGEWCHRTRESERKGRVALKSKWPLQQRKRSSNSSTRKTFFFSSPFSHIPRCLIFSFFFSWSQRSKKNVNKGGGIYWATSIVSPFHLIIRAIRPINLVAKCEGVLHYWASASFDTWAEREKPFEFGSIKADCIILYLLLSKLIASNFALFRYVTHSARLNCIISRRHCHSNNQKAPAFCPLLFSLNAIRQSTFSFWWVFFFFLFPLSKYRFGYKWWREKRRQPVLAARFIEPEGEQSHLFEYP